MARRKKISKLSQLTDWLSSHPRLAALALIILLALIYIPFRAYQLYADNQKFAQSRAAINTAYEAVAAGLGQPDALKSKDSCTKETAVWHGHITCRVETDFVYGVANRQQADVLLHQIQQVISRQVKVLHPVGKPAAAFSDSLVFDTYYHDALDNYRGPYHIACSVKYSFDTPDEVDLSLINPRKKPLEVFLACAGDAKAAYYPA